MIRPLDHVACWLCSESVHASGDNDVASLVAGVVTCVMISWCILEWIGRIISCNIANLT